MSNLVKLYARPKLNSPNMVAAWPGISNVSLLVATYLASKLDFKRLGEIEAAYFFNFSQPLKLQFAFEIGSH